MSRIVPQPPARLINGLLIIDELSYVTLSETGAELLIEVSSQGLRARQHG